MLPERFLPEEIETGVRLLTEKSVTVELLSMDKPELPAEVFTLARLIPERFNLPFAPLRLRELVFCIFPLPSRASAFVTFKKLD